MLMCTATATALRLSGGVWTAIPLRGVSLFVRSGVQDAQGGRTAARTVKLRIPAEACPQTLPEPGDLLVRGEIAAPASRAALRGQEVFTVTAVADNRRGGLAHVAVTAV